MSFSVRQNGYASFRIGFGAVALTICAVLAMPAPKASAQNLNSLVAFYNFDSSNANNSASTGAIYNGASNVVTYQNSVMRDGSGFAAEFNGTSSFIQTALDISPINMPEVTFGGWFYLTDINGTDIQALISSDNGGFDRDIDIDPRAGISSTGTLRWSAFAGPSTGVVQSGVAAETGSWHFIAATINATSQTLTLDVDGTTTSRNNVAYDTLSTSLQIGHNPGAGNEYFSGYADNVFVYNKVLTADDLTAIQNGGRDAIVAGAASAPEPGSLGLALCAAIPAAGLVLRRRSRQPRVA